MKNSPVGSNSTRISLHPESESIGPESANGGDRSVTTEAKKPVSITELAGEPVSRILFAARRVIPICIETSKRATR